MNWKLFAGTFVLIFLAELGDKTQLAAMARAAGAGGARWTVFLAASLALVFATLMAVMLGDLLTKVVPERTIKLAAGVLFVIFGVLILRAALAPTAEPVAAPVLPSGPLARMVLRAAAQFEQAAVTDYQTLAAATTDAHRKDLFLRLAAEETLHLSRLESAQPASDIRLADSDRPFPPAEALTHDVAAGDDPVLVHAIEHEESLADFYRELARVTPAPSLQSIFTYLAADELEHARQLQTCLQQESARDAGERACAT